MKGYLSLIFLGEKISPIEVDAVLLSHPDIAQAVAFGVPDAKYGEEVCPFLIYNFWVLQLVLPLVPYFVSFSPQTNSNNNEGHKNQHGPLHFVSHDLLHP